MSELTKLYEEIRDTQKHWRAGKINQDDATTELKFFKRREQVLKQKIAIRIHGYPDGGRKFLSSVDRAQVDNETEALKLLPLEIEHETVLCPLTNQEITRGECLEYSGEVEHYEDCKNCEIGLVNKKLLTPPIQESIR